MAAFLSALLSFVVPAFAVASMAATGAGSDLHEVLGPFRAPKMVITALIANFVVVPLLAYLLMRAFNLPQGHAVGLFLIASAAGAPFTLSLVRMAGGSLAKTGALMLLLVLATIVYLPLVVPLAIPEARVDAGGIALNLVSSMLLPLVLGAALRWFRQDLALRLVPLLGRITPVLLVTLIAATLLANMRGVLSIATAPPTLAAAALLVLGGVLAGYALGIPTRNSRVVLSLGTGQRNIAAATIVASSGLASPVPLTMVVTSSLVGFLILFPSARLFRGREEGPRPGRLRARGPREAIPQG